MPRSHYWSRHQRLDQSCTASCVDCYSGASLTPFTTRLRPMLLTCVQSRTKAVLQLAGDPAHKRGQLMQFMPASQARHRSTPIECRYDHSAHNAKAEHHLPGYTLRCACGRWRDCRQRTRKGYAPNLLGNRSTAVELRRQADSYEWRWVARATSWRSPSRETVRIPLVLFSGSPWCRSIPARAALPVRIRQRHRRGVRY